jgi:ferredoxin
MAEAGPNKWTIAIAGGEAEFCCTAGQSLLTAMINARRSAIRVGCRSGGCGVCRVRVIEGRYQSQKMTRSRISEADEAEGIVLACRILPQSNLAVEPLPITSKGAMA